MNFYFAREFCRACVLALLPLAALAGCSTAVQYTTHVPAEFEIDDLHRVAVLDFEGPAHAGAMARAAIAARLRDEPRFTLVSQDELAQTATGELRDSRGKLDLPKAIDAARKLNVDALLVGKLESFKVIDPNRPKSDELIDFDPEDIRTGKRNIFGFAASSESGERTHEATVAFTYQVIDVRTHRLRATKFVEHKLTRSLPDLNREDSPRKRAMAQLMKQCADDVVIAMGPHKPRIKVELARSSYWTTGSGEVSSGNAAARGGAWDVAAKHYEAALSANPANAAALANLPHAYLAMGKAEQAAVAIHQARKAGVPEIQLANADKTVKKAIPAQPAAGDRMDEEQLAAKEPARQATPQPVPAREERAIPASFNGPAGDTFTPLPGIEEVLP